MWLDTTKRLCTPFQFMYEDLDRSDKYVRQTIHTKNAERWWSRSFSKVVFFLIAKRRHNLNSQTTMKRKTTNENSETATKILQEFGILGFTEKNQGLSYPVPGILNPQRKIQSHDETNPHLPRDHRTKFTYPYLLHYYFFHFLTKLTK